MAMLEDLDRSASDDPGPAFAEPLLYEGQRLDQPTFHAIYERMHEDFKAELIDGVVHLAMTVHCDHGEFDAEMIGFLVIYGVETPGTRVRSNTTAKLGPRSEVQPDSVLLVLPEFGGRTRLEPPGIQIEAPELVVEISDSTLRRDLDAKTASLRAGRGSRIRRLRRAQSQVSLVRAPRGEVRALGPRCRRVVPLGSFPRPLDRRGGLRWQRRSGDDGGAPARPGQPGSRPIRRATRREPRKPALTPVRCALR